MTSSKDYNCMVWNLLNMTCVAICSGHSDSVGAIGLCSNLATYKSKRSFIVSGGADKVLKRWNFFPDEFLSGSPVILSPSHSIRAHDKDINSVSCSPNDSIVATASQDKTVKLWNASDLSCVAILRGHKRGVWKAVFSPVDKVLASCSGDKTVKIWSMSDFSLLRSFEGHTASVLCIAFIRKGNQIVSGSSDGLIRLWNVRTGECVNTFEGHEDKIWTIRSNSNSEETFFSGGGNSQLIVWKDSTVEEDLNKVRAVEHRLEAEQLYSNAIRSTDYSKVDNFPD